MDFPSWSVIQQAGGGLAVIGFVLWLIFRDNRHSGMNDLIRAAQERRQDMDQLRKDVHDLKQQNHEQESEQESSKRRLELLEMKMAELKRWRAAAVEYIKALHVIIAQHEGNLPSLPDELNEDFQ